MARLLRGGLLAAVAVLFVALPANAQVPVIPEEIRSAVPESQIVQVACGEAQWRVGLWKTAIGEFTAKYAPFVALLAGVKVSHSLPDLTSDTAKAQTDAQAICAAGTLAGAEAAIATLNATLTAAGQKLAASFDSVEAQVRAAGEAEGAELKAKYEKLGAAKEAELKAQGEADGRALQAAAMAEAAHVTSQAQGDALREKYTTLGEALKRKYESLAYQATTTLNQQGQAEGKLIEDKYRRIQDAGEQLRQAGLKFAGADALVAAYGSAGSPAARQAAAMAIAVIDKKWAESRDRVEQARASIDEFDRQQGQPLGTADRVIANLKSWRDRITGLLQQYGERGYYTGIIQMSAEYATRGAGMIQSDYTKYTAGTWLPETTAQLCETYRSRVYYTETYGLSHQGGANAIEEARARLKVEIDGLAARPDEKARQAAGEYGSLYDLMGRFAESVRALQVPTHAFLSGCDSAAPYNTMMGYLFQMRDREAAFRDLWSQVEALRTTLWQKWGRYA